MTETLSAQNLTLTVEITNIQSAKGNILLSLFNKADGFPDNTKNAVALKSKAAVKGKLLIEFTGLAAGTYAIAVFHDANADGKLNTNMMGIPKEDYGFSNNARPTFRAPNFEEAKFTINKSEQISIVIK